MSSCTLRVGLAVACSLAATMARATPHAVAPRTVQRFLRSYGYGSALVGDAIRLPDGTLRPLGQVRDAAALFALTTELPRAPFRGLLGLRSDLGAMTTLLENMERSPTPGPGLPASESIRLARDGHLEITHDDAMRQLRFGSGALAERIERLATTYAALNARPVAQLLRRKLTRLPDGDPSALRVGARIAEGADRADEAMRLFEQLVNRPDATPRDLALAARVSTRNNPEKALAFGRRAVALAPNDTNALAALGIAALATARLDLYTDERGVRRARAVGIAEGLHRLAQAHAYGHPTEHLAMMAHVMPEWSDERSDQLLREATRAYERGELDEAHRLALVTLEREPHEALAHHLAALVRHARVRSAEVALLRDQARPKVIGSIAHQREIIERARAAGIERLVPAFAGLSPERQANLARGALPWRARWPDLVQANSAIHIIPIGVPLPMLPSSNLKMDEKTFDGRYWYGTRGIASSVTRRAHVGAEDLDLVLHGTGFDTAAHELTHLVHYTLPAASKARITALYESALREGRIRDPYSRNNEREYFARGYELWLSHQDAVAWTAVKRDPPPLLAEDRALYDFITDLTGSTRSSTPHGSL